MKIISCVVFSILTINCNRNTSNKDQQFTSLGGASSSYKTIGEIPTPSGYKRIIEERNSFGVWLRNIPLKHDPGIYLFNGRLRDNQSTHFAVLDIPVGDKDLQQCADAIMRLRAEYLFSQGKYSEIEFRDNANKAYKWTKGADNVAFRKYLETVFGMCGSASLEKQLLPVARMQDIKAGDILIKGGFPGHAMIVVDVAVNDEGNKVFMLAQSYMPAQDIHIVKNPSDHTLSPWYQVTDEKEIITPEWTFANEQLRRW